MVQNGSVEEEEEEDGETVSYGGGTVVVVGVKLDSPSRELLTWALVKVAQPGDSVIALHVLGNNEMVDRDGNSSLLSLVKSFDSVLAVYEGFCNLKQVNLKLKICRGSSIRKILVREAKSCSATKLIVGTAAKLHKLRSSTSVAKYCAKKLTKNCSVLAINNGKIVFQRQASQTSNFDSQGTEHPKRNSLLNAIHLMMTSNKNSKAVSQGNAYGETNLDSDLEQALLKSGSSKLEHVSKTRQNCSICGSCNKLFLLDNSCHQSAKECYFGDGNDGDKSMAIVPVRKAEPAASSSSAKLIKQLPEIRLGWPLLRWAVLSDRQRQEVPDRTSSRQISVVQLAMRLPSRRALCLGNSDQRQEGCDQSDESCILDAESGAIVPVCIENAIAEPSHDQNSVNLPKELEGLHDKYSSTCRLFNYQELISATSNFLAENLIGKGGNSQVYRGCLRDGKELAVKILKTSEDVLKEFVLEIEIINALHHKNIISLLGFCYEDNNLLLVYDFLSRGSLEENLHGNKKDPGAFGWSERYKVALGVAEALDYLHTNSEHPVIHRDVKSSNILLSDDFEPQLSDFGLAKWASTTSSYITCADVAGTFGYLAPEYFMYGKVNDKIDVYAFGVVLLELLSGRKPISNDCPKGQESLVMWAKPILSVGKFSQLLDPSLDDGCYDRDQMESMVLAATLCIRRAPRARPPMTVVVKLLQGDDAVIKWARLQVNALEGSDTLDDDEAASASPRSNLQSHLSLALLDVGDDSLSSSSSSIEQSVSLEDYLNGRWSRSSSFD